MIVLPDNVWQGVSLVFRPLDGLPSEGLQSLVPCACPLNTGAGATAPPKHHHVLTIGYYICPAEGAQ